MKELNSLANQYEIVTLRSLNRKQLLQANGPKKDSVIESAIQRIQDSILFISVEYSKWINSKGIETDCFSQFTLNRWDQPETFESLRNTGEVGGGRLVLFTKRSEGGISYDVWVNLTVIVRQYLLFHTLNQTKWISTMCELLTFLQFPGQYIKRIAHMIMKI